MRFRVDRGRDIRWLTAIRREYPPGYTRGSMAQQFLGVDGGGTRTRAMIADPDGHVLGFGEGGPANLKAVSRERVRSGIADAVERASADAGGVALPFAGAFLGMAGVSTEADRQQIREIAWELSLAEEHRLGVDHDLAICLSGGLGDLPGIVLVAGTGSSCFARNAERKMARAGGWGSLLDDAGSAYDLGLQALRVTVRSIDGRLAETALKDAVMERLSLERHEWITRRVYDEGLTKAEIASLAKEVIRCAEEGDGPSIGLLERAAADLAELVKAVVSRPGFGIELPVVLAGGVALSGNPFQPLLERAISEAVPGIRTLAPRLAPVGGAVIMAMELAGVVPTEQIWKNLGSGKGVVIR